MCCSNFYRDTVSKFSTDASFDDNVYLTFRNNQAGTVGSGHFGSVCNPVDRLSTRSNLCEYSNDDMTTGLVRN